MKAMMLFIKTLGLFLFLSVFNSSTAEQIQVSSTFSCDTNAVCKTKCEALGSDHVWKKNPGGTPLGTCTKKAVSLVPSEETLNDLAKVSKNDKEIYEELKYLFSNSSVIKKLGIDGTQLNSFSLKLPIYDGPACASCLSPDVTIERCCPSSDPYCAFPCDDGNPILAIQ